MSEQDLAELKAKIKSLKSKKDTAPDNRVFSNKEGAKADQPLMKLYTIKIQKS